MTRRTILQLMGMGAVQALLSGCGMGNDESSKAATTQPSKEDPAMDQATQQTVKVKVFNSKAELVGPIDEPKVVKSDAEWQKLLTPTQYQIARNKGTEAAFCGTLLDNHKNGTYACVCCRLPLFTSDSKFTSGTGWPSFFQPIAEENVVEHSDRSYGMVRNEILCARCDGHLGHVFDDGPRPTGLRFCVNSDSLVFVSSTDTATLADPAAKT